jgi:hypothetical protein
MLKRATLLKGPDTDPSDVIWGSHKDRPSWASTIHRDSPFAMLF